MRWSTWSAGLLGIVLLLTFAAAPAQAQATRTWVSGVGDDANPCSRTAPCKTFAGAISKTAAGGEISVLDPGGFGAVTITKSISIINDYSGEAGILASGTNGITVNAGASDIVILRGLVIDGAPPGTPGLNGIRFLNGAALHVQKCLIKNFTGAAPNGAGILFAPSGTAELYVDDTFIANTGTAGGGGGIFIQPTGAGVARVSIDNVRSENNTHGIRADSTTTTGSITANIYRSTAAGNTGSGVLAQSAVAAGTPINMMISNSGLLVNNNGLNAIGSGVTVRIGNSTITGSLNLGVNIGSSATVLSYKNNQIDGNNNNGTPVTAVGAASPAAGLN
jgi:hypothetical protein